MLVTIKKNFCDIVNRLALYMMREELKDDDDKMVVQVCQIF
jgi:hypothetical protein